MIQGECEKCEDRGDFHGYQCIVRILIFDLKTKRKSPHRMTPEEAMNAAVIALETHKQREKKYV